MKTLHTGHGGKLSVARVLRGAFQEGDTVVGSRGAEARIGGLLTLMGSATTRTAEAEAGRDGRLRPARGHRHRRQLRRRQGAARRHRLGRAAGAGLRARRSRSRTARTTCACRARLPRSPRRIRRSSVETRPEIGEMRLLGQGEMHLRVAVERLAVALPGRRRDRQAAGRLLRDDQAAGRRPAAGTASRPAATASSATW